jgi:ATP-binding cassette subfamily B protein
MKRGGKQSLSVKALHLIRPYFRDNRLPIFIGLACLICVDFAQLFIPRIIKWAVDDLTAMRADPSGLLSYAFYMGGIALLIGALRYVWRLCLIGTSRKVEEGLRNQLFAHVQTLSASYFDKTKTGDLMAHATNDIMNIRMALGMGIVALTDAVVLGLASIGFMAYIHIELTGLVLIPMPLIVFGTRFFSKRMHRLYQKVQSAFADLTEAARERFAGIRIIKAHNLEAIETTRMDAVSREYIRWNIGLVKITGSFFPMMVFLSNLSLAIVLFVGGRRTITGAITPGDFVAFISYLALLTWPMMALGWVTNLIQRGSASLVRLDRILTTAPEIRDRPDAKPIGRARGDILFEKVSFAYAPGGAPVLSGLDFRVRPGEVLGIVGPPGSGKTTAVSLIPRLYDPVSGSVRLDRVDVRDIRLKDLRDQIAFVPQEPFLFAGSIRENIAFGASDPSGEALAGAARDALLLETIRSFPDGFDTLVGEKGVILSGGQKQRVALSRAFLIDSPLLILDDPISQVDMETGARILGKIQEMIGKRTIIIVSHRLSAVRFANRIIALDRGRIVESGTHAELMRVDGYYAATFRLQEIEEELHAL